MTSSKLKELVREEANKQVDKVLEKIEAKVSSEERQQMVNGVMEMVNPSLPTTLMIDRNNEPEIGFVLATWANERVVVFEYAILAFTTLFEVTGKVEPGIAAPFIAAKMAITEVAKQVFKDMNGWRTSEVEGVGGNDPIDA